MNVVVNEVVDAFFNTFEFPGITDLTKESVIRRIEDFEEIVYLETGKKAALRVLELINNKESQDPDDFLIFGSIHIKFLAQELFNRRQKSREIRTAPKKMTASELLDQYFTEQSEGRPKELVAIAEEHGICRASLYIAKSRTKWLGSTKDRRNGWWYITDESY